ncbi:hypothetical protein ACPPVU_23510 [Mucilaginibacter sp. McL0603]|uniref:hypothetical protein n=1 Tax=Mucilaginibacter sp. McL0603 TaxID=3415670 RepID=UPI003CF34F5A
MEINELIKIVDSYYPEGITLNDPELLNNSLFIKLLNVCLEANENNYQWIELLKGLKNKLSIEITEFVLLTDCNPSFVAVFLTENYERPKPKDYEPFQLILKISVIAPVYSIYFDNFVSDGNKRIIKSNPTTEKEKLVFNEVQESVIKLYQNYSPLDLSMAFHMLSHLGDISISNKRKPFLDECIFGSYLSIHPYNYLEDRIAK